MRSFDYFDTLVTRLVAEPGDLFRLVEMRVGAPGFAKSRQAAELAARLATPGREVTLDDIYACLQMSEDLRRRAREEELRLERELVSPISFNLDRLETGDLVVSDIYLPPQALDEVLQHLRPEARPLLFVSSAVGVRKAEGGLWDHVLQAHAALEEHVGDNRNSDVLQPSRRGIRAEHFTRSLLNRYERALNDGTLDGSIVAACSRAARLTVHRSGDDDALAALGDVFASVFAPAFTCFVDSVLTSCAQHGIRRVLFLARDGQLLFRIAQALVLSRGLDLEPVYVYGSRQALHLPGFTNIDQAESWLLENTPVLTLRDIAERAGVDVELVVRISERHGLWEIDRNLSPTERAALPKLIREAEFVNALTAVSAARWSAAWEYYRGIGIGAPAPVALVDVGWNGRMQSSLRGIMSKGGSSESAVAGFYFCLTRKLRHSCRDTLQGFAFDPEHSKGRNCFDGYRAIIEAALEADHGAVLRFEIEGDRVCPVLAATPSEPVLQMVRRQQEAVLAFVSALCRAESAIGRCVEISKQTALDNVLHLLRAPSLQEAQAFEGRERSEGQVESYTQMLVRHVPFGVALLRRSSLGFWPEGTVARSGHRWLLPAYRWARLLRACLARG